MRKIKKDLNDIPCSLAVNDKQQTHKCRKELIKARSYIEETKYDSRYKMSDIKEKLKAIYHSKCAYCESKVEQGHVEHYRPKNIYYWLAYSWDNLLYGCPTCNQFKGTKFEIIGPEAGPPKENDDLSDINSCSLKYDSVEKPKLLNPERDSLDNLFVFDMQGQIKGNNNTRADYTINTCHLCRKYLVDERKKIVDDFKCEVKAECLNATTKNDQKNAIECIIRMFIRKSEDETSTFTAYRKAAISWLDDIVKDITK